MGDGPRPAFYALRPGGWRDLITLLHPPYTAWHLSYVAIGAAVAPHLHHDRTLAALAAFFLAVGVGAHGLDELRGRPLGTQVSDRALTAVAIIGLGGGVAIGAVGIATVSATLIPFVVAGAFICVAYNLELFGGRFHTDFWFAAAWGAFPAATGYWVNALGFASLRGAAVAVLVVGFCFWLSVAQRRLSTPVRELRRRTKSLRGTQRLADGTTKRLGADSIAAPLDGALRALAGAVVLLATALIVLRW